MPLAFTQYLPRACQDVPVPTWCLQLLSTSPQCLLNIFKYLFSPQPRLYPVSIRCPPSSLDSVPLSIPMPPLLAQWPLAPSSCPPCTLHIQCGSQYLPGTPVHPVLTTATHVLPLGIPAPLSVALLIPPPTPLLLQPEPRQAAVLPAARRGRASGQPKTEARGAARVEVEGLRPRPLSSTPEP